MLHQISPFQDKKLQSGHVPLSYVTPVHNVFDLKFVNSYETGLIYYSAL